MIRIAPAAWVSPLSRRPGPVGRRGTGRVLIRGSATAWRVMARSRSCSVAGLARTSAR